MQLTVSLVEFIGLFRANVESGLLHCLGITYELLLVETRGKSAGVTAAWMTEIRFTRRPWQHVVSGLWTLKDMVACVVSCL